MKQWKKGPLVVWCCLPHKINKNKTRKVIPHEERRKQHHPEEEEEGSTPKERADQEAPPCKSEDKHPRPRRGRCTTTLLCLSLRVWRCLHPLLLDGDAWSPPPFGDAASLHTFCVKEEEPSLSSLSQRTTNPVGRTAQRTTNPEL